MPLRAWFASPPDQHDGSKAIKVRVGFSEAPENVGADGVEVEDGEVTSVRPVDGNASGAAGKRLAGGQDGEVVWEIEIEPDSLADVTVSLSAWRPCDETGAICTADGRVLSQGISTTVRGPAESSDDSGGEEPSEEQVSAESPGDSGGGEPSEEQVSDESSDDPGGEEQESLTARFEGMPAAHDGASAFRFRMAFSEPLSWMNGRRLREDVVAVAGGRATKASRVNRRRDLWQLTVEPDSPADVTVTLAAGAACDTPAAVCTKDGRALSQGISTTVRGPAADEQESPATGQDQDPGQSVSEGATDLPNDNTTPGRVAVGGSATGTIGIPEDQDRFAVDLEAGRTYRFDLTGRPGGGGTLPDTYFRAIYNSEGRYQSGSYNDDFDGGRDSRVTFTRNTERDLLRAGVGRPGRDRDLHAVGDRRHGGPGVQAGGRGRAAGAGAQRAQPLQRQHPHPIPAGCGRTGAPGDLQPPRAAPAHTGGRGAGRRRLPGALGRPRRTRRGRGRGGVFHAPALSGRGADPADALPEIGPA